MKELVFEYFIIISEKCRCPILFYRPHGHLVCIITWVASSRRHPGNWVMVLVDMLFLQLRPAVPV